MMDYQQKTPTKDLFIQTLLLIFRTPLITIGAVGFMVAISFLYDAVPSGIGSYIISILTVDIFYAIICFIFVHFSNCFNIKCSGNGNLKSIIKDLFSCVFDMFNNSLLLLMMFFFITHSYLLWTYHVTFQYYRISLFDSLTGVYFLYLLLFHSDIFSHLDIFSKISFVYPLVRNVMDAESSKIVSHNIIQHNHALLFMVAIAMFLLCLLSLSFNSLKLTNPSIVIVILLVLNFIYYYLQIFKMVLVFDVLGYNLVVKKNESKIVMNNELSTNNI